MLLLNCLTSAVPIWSDISSLCDRTNFECCHHGGLCPNGRPALPVSSALRAVFPACHPGPLGFPSASSELLRVATRALRLGPAALVPQSLVGVFPAAGSFERRGTKLLMLSLRVHTVRAERVLVLLPRADLRPDRSGRNDRVADRVVHVSQRDHG